MYRSTVSQETAVGRKLTDIRSSRVLSKLTYTRSSQILSKLPDTRSQSKHIKPAEPANQVKCPCSADTDSQVTFRRLSAVDRCIASLRSAFSVNAPHAGLMLFGSLVCGVG